MPKPQTTHQIAISLLIGLLIAVFGFGGVVLAEGEPAEEPEVTFTPNPSTDACIYSEAHGANSSLDLVLPPFDWNDNPQLRDNDDILKRCQLSQCLQEKYNYIKGFENDYTGPMPEKIEDLQDRNCRDYNDGGLKCGDGYYKTSEDARIDTSRNCTIEPIEICSNSLMQIDQQCRLQSDQASVQVNGAPYNCKKNYICTARDRETPRETTDEDVKNGFVRTPYDTEYFNVNDPDRGLITADQNRSRFNTEVEGGPIVGTINTVANFLAAMISLASLLIFIIGAFLLITANGEENQISRGKDALKFSLLGIIIVMFSYTIVVLVQSIFF